MILIGCLFLASCSSIKCGYSYADWVILWKLDDFFDLTSEQREFLNPQVDQHLIWHKTKELPLYISFLKQVREKSQDDLTDPELDWIYDQIEEHRKKIVKRIAPDFSVFLASLKEEQIEYFNNYLPQMNEHLLEQLELPPDERQEKREEETLERVEEWVGKLSDDQKTRIIQLSRSIPDISKEGLKHHEEIGSKRVVFLRQREAVPDIEEQLLEWFVDFERTYSLEYRQVVIAQHKASKYMIIGIDQMLTSSQRSHFLKKLDELIEEVEDILRS